MGEYFKKLTVLVATDAQLKDPAYYAHLWETCKRLTHLSSRGWVRAIEAFFRDTDLLGIQFMYPGGKPYAIPYMFDILPLDEESAQRWFSFFLKGDETGLKPGPFPRNPERLRAIDLYLRATVADYARPAAQPDLEKAG